MRAWWLIVVVGVAISCAKPPECETGHTGTISIGATGDSCFTVTMNGVSEGQVCSDEPDVPSLVFAEEPAGQVVVQTNIANGSTACDDVTVNVAECSSQRFDCDARVGTMVASE